MISAASLSPFQPGIPPKRSVKARYLPRLSISVWMDRAFFWATTWSLSTIEKPEYQTVVRNS
ncbi:MAG: hypothetical protein VXZ31_05670, partial [Pseudomonadota bacterium]|nr:hypothetical protein [Pseudomonadota bacterium]